MCQGRRLGSIILLLSFTACGSAHPGWKSFPVPIYADAKILNSPQNMGDLRDAFAFWEEKAGKPVYDL